jgi:hypothetical protein
MPKYIDDMLNEYNNIEGTAATPAANYLFEVMSESPELDDIKREVFHAINY